MADIFWDGFDRYGLPGAQLANFGSQTVGSIPGAGQIMLGEWLNYLGGNAQSTSGTISLVPGRFTGQALQFTYSAGNAGPAVRRNLPANYTTYVFGVAFNSTLSNSAWIGFLDNNNYQVTVFLVSSGKLIPTTGYNAGNLGTSTVGVTANTWHYLEGQITINNSTGSLVLNLDGTQILNLTSVNTRGGSANNFIGQVELGGDCTILFDDMYMFDTTGAANNAMRGDSRVETLFPKSDGTVQFTYFAGIMGYSIWGSWTNSNAPGANELVLIPVTPVASGTLSSISLLTNATSTAANFRGVVYADSSGSPGALLGTAGTQVTGCTAFATLTLGLTQTQTITASTQYWIGYITDTSIALLEAYNTLDPVLGRKIANTYSNGAPATAGAMTTGQPTWTIWGNITGQSTHWSEVQAVPPPFANVSYLYSATAGQTDHYNFTSLSTVPTSVAGVKLSVYAERADAGTRTIDLQINSGGTTGSGSNTSQTATAGSYTFLNSYFDTDPNTSSAWTGAAINAVAAGPKVDT